MDFLNDILKEMKLKKIYEEIGIITQIIAGFRATDKHPIPNKKDVIKRILYFIAEYDNQQLCYQAEELEVAYLMTYEEAMKLFQFESSKRILNEAKELIE
ncbi:hypothetical protein SAMN02745163_03046 [Clostridium cavendishii DSM 21758]|uniref:Uncharacterized protein n=1 Tax=Clostridium cavendishii DSM 21758 TaxID=1121302 RepID=A0A1M6P692_9CLOT|nr:hypothetical protein [Clostridium cavendishii]SHK03519.1 hypothetical protein SAMN02745163_03046 [Clostridium cavendishii DSM 21758]